MSQISRLDIAGDIQQIRNVYLVFMSNFKFLDLKKVEFYQKLLYLAKYYEPGLWKCFANRKCIILYGITKKKFCFGTLAPIFQIAQ